MLPAFAFSLHIYAALPLIIRYAMPCHSVVTPHYAALPYACYIRAKRHAALDTLFAADIIFLAPLCYAICHAAAAAIRHDMVYVMLRYTPPLIC